MTGRARLMNRTGWNVVANGTTAIVNGFIGILTISFLARELGPEKYGIWVLIGLATGYMVVLDFGLIAATGRRLAANYAVGDETSASRIASTHIAATFGLGLMICLASLGGAMLFGVAFAVPPDLTQQAQFGVMLTGASVAIYFFFSLFTCRLWARERFDAIAAIDIPVALAKMLAIILFIDSDSTLPELAAITIPGNLIAGLATIAACRRIDPGIRLRPSLVSFAELRETLRLGLNLFTHQFTRTASALTGTTIAGNRLGPDDVTSYALARTLTSYAGGFVDSVAQAAAARSVKLHSGGQGQKQKELFLIGGRYATGCSMMFLGGFLVLGEPFVRLWQGGRHGEVVALLTVLAIGETLAMSQSVTNSVLLGMNRQASLIRLFLLDILVTIVIGVLLVSKFGVLGICLAVAFSSFAVRGIGHILIGCNALKVRPIDFFNESMLPTFGPMLIALFSTFIILNQSGIKGFLDFFVVGIFYVTTFLMFSFILVFKGTFSVAS